MFRLFSALSILAIALSSASGDGKQLEFDATCGQHVAEATKDATFYRGDDWKALTDDQKLALLWTVSQEGAKKIRKQVKFSDALLHNLLATVMAHEFAFLTGEPGGSKSATSTLVLQAELRTVSDAQKKIFAQQFDKLLTDGVITGFPKTKRLIDEGITEINRTTSLVGDDFLFALLDEMEKANPATLAALLSVLNERRVLLGDEIVDILLIAGFANSNKTLAEFLAAFEEDRPTGEALLDRFLHKSVVPGQTSNADEDLALAKHFLAPRRTDAPAILGMHQLAPLIREVKLPDEVIESMATLLVEMDSQFTKEADEIRTKIRQGERIDEYVPASQFSNRSMRRIMKMMKASFLVEQLLDGVAPEKIRYVMEEKDLVHLAIGTVYGGPGKLRPQRVVLKGNVKGAHGARRPNVDIEVDPWSQRVYFRRPENAFELEMVQADVATQTLDAKYLDDPATRAALFKAITDNQNNPVQYEESGEIQLAIAMPGATARTQQQYKYVQQERKVLKDQLNALLSRPPTAAPTTPATAPVAATPLVTDVAKARLETLLKKPKSKRTVGEQGEIAWLRAQVFYENTGKSFIGVEHATRAFLVSLLTDNHLFLFGPAGGAKTSLLNHVFNAELRGMRELSDEPAELFFLQFNKLTPQAKLVGSPILSLQMDTGERRYQVRGSMVDRRFRFAGLDEVEKGSPPVHTKLLGVLNERVVLHGSETFEAALLVAAMASNKTTNEFLDAFGDDRSAGEAILARALNKVYISNKFKTTAELVDYLKATERGRLTPSPDVLQMQQLKPLLDKVKIPETTLRIAVNVRRQFLDKRSKVAERSKAEKRDAPLDRPYAYEPANYGSNRNLKADMQQWKAAFLIQQLSRGKSFDEIRFTMEPQDVILMGQGLAYWGPWRPLGSSQHGIVQYTVGTEIDAFLGRSYIDERQRFTLASIKDEATDFVTILNQAYLDTAMELRDFVGQAQVAQGLVRDEAAFRAWVRNP